ncbi:hypothetical protein D3M95_09115 [Corynebacterium falsenii]|uniref:Uncharacterized protein n=1 Tax=Corynebacterium falsenii TaxID=108486 RepID=A0A418Q5F2_9CORY|nr:hypothetical protein [Corynebacterium falsenii]RIX33842.1 hypothetical protein D3M95_09115 [Corynebacterium falsenii]
MTADDSTQGGQPNANGSADAQPSAKATPSSNTKDARATSQGANVPHNGENKLSTGGRDSLDSADTAVIPAVNAEEESSPLKKPTDGATSEKTDKTADSDATDDKTQGAQSSTQTGDTSDSEKADSEKSDGDKAAAQETGGENTSIWEKARDFMPVWAWILAVGLVLALLSAIVSFAVMSSAKTTTTGGVGEATQVTPSYPAATTTGKYDDKENTLRGGRDTGGSSGGYGSGSGSQSGSGSSGGSGATSRTTSEDTPEESAVEQQPGTPSEAPSQPETGNPGTNEPPTQPTSQPTQQPTAKPTAQQPPVTTGGPTNQ